MACLFFVLSVYMPSLALKFLVYDSFFQQKEQMDDHIRYQDGKEKEVCFYGRCVLVVVREDYKDVDEKYSRDFIKNL